MCMMITINKLSIGARDLGYELFDGKQMVEMTSKQIKDLIKGGRKVCGLCIGTDGELELDKADFFTTNMMVHSHINNWRSMMQDSMTNLLYVCIGSHKEADKVVYDCISSRFEQAVISENDMRAYLKLGIVSGGAKLDGEKIVLADLEYKKEELEAGAEVKEEKKEGMGEVKPAPTVAAVLSGKK